MAAAFIEPPLRQSLSRVLRLPACLHVTLKACRSVVMCGWVDGWLDRPMRSQGTAVSWTRADVDGADRPACINCVPAARDTPCSRSRCGVSGARESIHPSTCLRVYPCLFVCAPVPSVSISVCVLSALLLSPIFRVDGVTTRARCMIRQRIASWSFFDGLCVDGLFARVTRLVVQRVSCTDAGAVFLPRFGRALSLTCSPPPTTTTTARCPASSSLDPRPLSFSRMRIR